MLHVGEYLLFPMYVQCIYGLAVPLMQSELVLSISFQIFISNVNPFGELLIQTWCQAGVFTVLATFNGLFTNNSKYAGFYIPFEGEGDSDVLKTQEIK